MSNDMIATLAGFVTTSILKQPKRVLRADEPLLSSGLIDSFHLVDLGLFVEKTFDVRIDDADLNADTFDTLEQLAEVIRAAKAG
ncbi:MAG: acyl carrier protein [Thermoflexales bacterium]|nr:acyl carrier protein [Thermoflexales bacterium]